jgi:GNAT superfamily N-acetyltransferase
MIIRQAKTTDAQGMSEVLKPIIASWSSDRQTNPAFLITQYVSHPDSIACHVAEGNTILGFQSLREAKQGNLYNLPAGWGMIGTYVDLHLSGKGIGRLLFEANFSAAKAAKLTTLDATIGKNNPSALAYYDAMGFLTYRTTEVAICKRLDLE